MLLLMVQFIEVRMEAIVGSKSLGEVVLITIMWKLHQMELFMLLFPLMVWIKEFGVQLMDKIGLILQIPYFLLYMVELQLVSIQVMKIKYIFLQLKPIITDSILMCFLMVKLGLLFGNMMPVIVHG